MNSSEQKCVCGKWLNRSNIDPRYKHLCVACAIKESQTQTPQASKDDYRSDVFPSREEKLSVQIETHRDTFMTAPLPELLTFTNIEFVGDNFLTLAQQLNKENTIELEVFKIADLTSVKAREQAIAQRLKEFLETDDNLIIKKTNIILKLIDELEKDR